jgi:competence protein ComEA
MIYLIAILLLVSFTPRLLVGFQNNKLSWSYSELKSAEENLQSKVDQSSRSWKKKRDKRNRYHRPSSKFDPNEYSKEDWMRLGLSEKQSDVVLRFTKKGVHSNVELKKIFVIPDALFELIKDSTEYKWTPKSNSASDKLDNKSRVPKEIYDLNTVDKGQLMSLPGIGDYFSDKIIAFRDKLGGFHSKSQLLEVWNFSEEKYFKIESLVKVEGEVKKININTCSMEELKRHPYLRYAEANSIVKMRMQSGGYTEISDIKRSKLIDQELFEKIKPYLTTK